MREKRKAAIDKIRAERGKWMSPRSELISYAKMLSDYFTYISTNSDYEGVTESMERFCRENNL